MKTECKDCKHCIEVFDRLGGKYRGACTLLYLLVGLTSGACGLFEHKVPQVPYIPRLDPRMVVDLRFHLLAVENILRVLEKEQIPPQRKGLG